MAMDVQAVQQSSIIPSMDACTYVLRAYRGHVSDEWPSAFGNVRCAHSVLRMHTTYTHGTEYGHWELGPPSSPAFPSVHLYEYVG